jgi:hypothetical protein
VKKQKSQKHRKSSVYGVFSFWSGGKKVYFEVFFTDKIGDIFILWKSVTDLL